MSIVHLQRHGQAVVSFTLHRVLLPDHGGGWNGFVGDLQVELLTLNHNDVLSLQLQGGGTWTQQHA